MAKAVRNAKTRKTVEDYVLRTETVEGSNFYVFNRFDFKITPSSYYSNSLFGGFFASKSLESSDLDNYDAYDRAEEYLDENEIWLPEYPKLASEKLILPTLEIISHEVENGILVVKLDAKKKISFSGKNPNYWLVESLGLQVSAFDKILKSHLRNGNSTYRRNFYDFAEHNIEVKIANVVLPKRNSRNLRGIYYENHNVFMCDYDCCSERATSIEDFSAIWIAEISKKANEDVDKYAAEIFRLRKELVEKSTAYGTASFILNVISQSTNKFISDTIEKIKTIPTVTGVAFTHQAMIVETTDLWAMLDSTNYYMGQFAIQIKPTGQISISNNKMLKQGVVHPHSGHLGSCLGSFEDVIADCLRKFDYYQAVLTVIEYLQQINPKDTAAVNTAKKYFKTSILRDAAYEKSKSTPI